MTFPYADQDVSVCVCVSWSGVRSPELAVLLSQRK